MSARRKETDGRAQEEEQTKRSIALRALNHEIYLDHLAARNSKRAHPDPQATLTMATPDPPNHTNPLHLDQLAVQSHATDYTIAAETAVSDQDASEEEPYHPDEAMHRRGSINTARRRPSHVPRVNSESYPAFRKKQKAAMRICLKELKSQLHRAMAVLGMEFCEHGNGLELTFDRDRQSKLSQQELQDLQKATHFDKKELQQWYKGMDLAHLQRISRVTDF